MKNIMKKLYKQLKGWNLTDNYERFDFYSEDEDAILTMVYRDGVIKIADSVEYYSETYYTDYESLTLNEYENRLQTNNEVLNVQSK